MQFAVDGISFELKKEEDFSWLRRYGTVFCVFDQNDSGNISFGVAGVQGRLFIKVAGAETMRAAVSSAEALENLRQAAGLYVALAHPQLIRLVETVTEGALFAAVFIWSEGECLFDHWNFERYKREGLPSPRERFLALPIEQRLACAETLFSFLETVAAGDYVAVDFYEGSILYDFEQAQITICDIDLFAKRPYYNGMGMDFWGTKRLKSPEEYEKGAVIDEQTNVFTMGALLFHFFGNYQADEIEQMYESNQFFPPKNTSFALSEKAYAVLQKATACHRADRYPSMATFWVAWRRGLTDA